MDKVSDSQLWNEFLKGSDSALETIYRQYVNVLYNYGRQFSSDTDLVRDAVQELFCELIQSRERLGATTSIKFYLLASLRNKLVRKVKHEDRFSSLNDFGGDFQIDFAADSDILRELCLDQSGELLQEAFNKLPIKQREAILLYFYEDVSYEEIAQIMEMTKVKSARALIYRALDSLQEIFNVGSKYSYPWEYPLVG
ncbi:MULTISPECIES: RNA polymerase sigma factor [Arcicella]|uniref:Sigma-70 family RNA polymerase sigma factor n=1 Tax=Arcicella lustrica TaxID=2984196 RepID=A0ABU5SPA2_9BACT|nr:sigma-70 family RNA polymerase sigma factor [Arcicella sp. DC25W]MEA5429087.1 sigma-70 family RNA polymerase sigma factor [Arcicella sp. DC25W]|eukprot:Opistho-1_new@56408